MPVGVGFIASPSCILSGALEILGLLRTLGEGYRLSCMYRCQVLTGVYKKIKVIIFSGLFFTIQLIGGTGCTGCLHETTAQAL